MGIHRNHDLFPFSHQRVTVFNLLLYPNLEDLSKDCCTYINDPLLGDLQHIGLVREVGLYSRPLFNEGKDLFKA